MTDTGIETDKPRNPRVVNAFRTMPVQDVPAGAYYASTRIAASRSALPDGGIEWLLAGEWVPVGMPTDRRLVEVLTDEHTECVLMLNGWHPHYF
jgi:hypothetical protein